jgi:hypothetical protein
MTTNNVNYNATPYTTPAAPTAPIHPMTSSAPAESSYSPGAYSSDYATPDNTYNGAYSSTKPLQIEEGKLPGQALHTIAKYDEDKDGVWNYNEALIAGKNGEFGPGFEKLKLGREELQGWFATVAGPTGDVSVREYAQTLVGIDKNRDGKITAEEAAIQKEWAKAAVAHPGESNVRTYNSLVDAGSSVGLDKLLPKGHEQRFAAKLDDKLDSGYDKDPYATDKADPYASDKPASEAKPYGKSEPYNSQDRAEIRELLKEILQYVKGDKAYGMDKAYGTDSAKSTDKAYGTDAAESTDKAYGADKTKAMTKEEAMKDFLKMMFQTMIPYMSKSYGTDKAASDSKYDMETGKPSSDYSKADDYTKSETAKADKDYGDMAPRPELMKKLLPLFLMFMLKLLQTVSAHK